VLKSVLFNSIFLAISFLRIPTLLISIVTIPSFQ
jgi:hypothetical protein